MARNRCNCPTERRPLSSGGAPKFRAFLNTELIPHIEANYRVTKDRTIVGHSYGGLVGAWVLFTQPDLFTNYFLVSPSLWHDNKLLFRLEQDFAAKHKALPAKAYLTIGDLEVNDHDMVNDQHDLTEQIKCHAYERLSLRTQTMTDETHNTIFPLRLTHGLRFLYPTHK